MGDAPGAKVLGEKVKRWTRRSGLEREVQSNGRKTTGSGVLNRASLFRKLSGIVHVKV